jgi:hypothetical protein
MIPSTMTFRIVFPKLYLNEKIIQIENHIQMAFNGLKASKYYGLSSRRQELLHEQSKKFFL